MKFACEIEIEAPRDYVVAAFCDSDKLQHWQDGFKSKELIQGEAWQKDAQSKFIYQNGRNHLELVETIISNKLPDEFEAM